MESIAAILIFAPIITPALVAAGVDPAHLGVVVVLNLLIGLMTPPIGIGFYIACKIGNVSPDEAMGAIWPYLVALIIGLVIIAVVPGLSTWVL